MPLRSFLFSSDEETAELVRQVLAGLGVEGESCSDATDAAERIANQAFQIVIVDWNQQPESGLLLTAARERKPAERPITLAIVSNDRGAPEALHAGANSILRRPIVASQVRDTLTTARDLLRAKQESATASLAAAAAASAGPPPSSIPTSREPQTQKVLRAGEFLQSGSNAPGTHFVTDSDVASFPEESAASQVDPLKDLEPVAASVSEESLEPTLPSLPSEPRGLEWYLKARGAKLQPTPVQPPTAQSSAQPELLGYDQTISYSAPAQDNAAPPRLPDAPLLREEKHEEKREVKEAELFAYIDDGTEPQPSSHSSFRLGKRAIIGALVIAGCAIAAAPQAPWHGQTSNLWSRGQHALHSWLNPQPITPVQAPVSHEDFGRAGDEYKLPVTENIPDATTDPSQVQVLPVIDPTAKKPNPDVAPPDPPAGEPGGSAVTPDQAQSPSTPTPESQPTQALQTAISTTAQTSPGVAPSPTMPAPAATAPTHVEPHASSTPGNVPSSLKSQMITMTPDASGNKPPDAAMPSIEPVNVPEVSERALLTDQPPVAYPANAKGQKGTVILQVLIGRDGTVQDAKFLQGSLAFARAAIDGVKEWKFKPYTMNGRPVSVQTTLTLRF